MQESEASAVNDADVEVSVQEAETSAVNNADGEVVSEQEAEDICCES